MFCCIFFQSLPLEHKLHNVRDFVHFVYYLNSKYPVTLNRWINYFWRVSEWLSVYLGTPFSGCQGNAHFPFPSLHWHVCSHCLWHPAPLPRHPCLLCYQMPSAISHPALPKTAQQGPRLHYHWPWRHGGAELQVWFPTEEVAVSFSTLCITHIPEQGCLELPDIFFVEITLFDLGSQSLCLGIQHKPMSVTGKVVYADIGVAPSSRALSLSSGHFYPLRSLNFSLQSVWRSAATCPPGMTWYAWILLWAQLERHLEWSQHKDFGLYSVSDEEQVKALE